MSALDGIVDTPATAELNGGGRTNLNTGDNCEWQILDDSFSPVTASTAAGITKVAGTTYMYTVNFTRPATPGTYYMRFKLPHELDGGGNPLIADESFECWFSLSEMEQYTSTPGPADIGARMRARTKDINGDELGTFNDNTRPTGDQVNALIVQAQADVLACLDDTIPPRAYAQVFSSISLRTCMLIELSFWPEQITTGQSPYTMFEKLYEAQIKDTMEAVDRANSDIAMDEDPNNNNTPLTPQFCFPPATSNPYIYLPYGQRPSIGEGTIW